MKTQKQLLTLVCLISLSVSALAQTTATWSNAGLDYNWNNPANWDTLDVPGVGTNAVIGAGAFVTNSSPMTAANFAGVNNSGTLSVNAAGFNIDALGTLPAYTGNAISLLQIGSSGVFVATNSAAITLSTSNMVTVDGGVLIITNSTGNINFGLNANNQGAGFTNNGGTVVFSQPFFSKGRFSRFESHGGSVTLLGGGGITESSNDQERRFLIDGGTASLGNFTIGRTLNTVGSAGLVISNNAVVNVTGLQIGTGIAASGATINSGTLTNTGTFTISDRNNAATTGTRQARFFVRGGTVVSTSPSGIIISPQTTSTGGAGTAWGGYLDINAGTIIAEQLTLVGPSATSFAYASLNLSGSGAIYLGSGGLVCNGTAGNTTFGYTNTLSGGTLGAKADYSIVGNATLSGTFTVKAADLADTPYNITNTGIWSGTGASLVKSGGGVLTLTANNTYSGVTTISAGTLSLGVSGSISNTTSIAVGSGATFDFSANPAGFVLGAAKTLTGSGTVSGNFTNAATSVINPSSTLTFNGSVSQSGGAINHFDLPTTPGPGNDRIDITGDLNVSGVNTIEVVGGGSPGTVHTLIQYGNNFNGTVANFALSGASGILSNDAPTRTIALIVQEAVRNPTNVVWLGGLAANAWDTLTSSNWLNVGAASRDVFVTGDNARFDDTGATNPIVFLVGNNAPSSVMVDTTSNYTFTGSGAISGTGSLTKTNTGTLTITSTNTYSGVTTISGGVLEAGTLAIGGTPCSIGAALPASANVVLDGGTLRYTGPSASIDRGATINSGGGTIDVATGGAVLTVSGTLTGTGTLTKSGAGNLTLTAANTYTNGTVINGGVLQLNNATGAATGPVTNNGATMGVSGAIVVNNALNFNGACNLEFSGVGSGNIALRGAWSGSGTVTANFVSQNTSQTFTIGGDNGSGGGAMWDFSGTLDLSTNTGFCRLNNSSATVNYGSSNAVFNLGTGNLLFNNRNGGTTTHIGALMGGPNTTLSGARGDVTGTTTFSIGGKNLDTVFEGVITNATISSSVRPAAIIKVGTGKLTLTGDSPYTGSTIISNGVLALSGSGSIGSTPTIDIVAGAGLDSSARTDGALRVHSGQTVLGEGAVYGSVTVLSNATLSPGPAAGVISKLTITNVLTAQPGGILLMDADHTTATNDVIDGLASITYGGTLTVNLTSVDITSSFKLFNAGAYSGMFDTITPASPGPGWLWDTSSLTVNGTLKVKNFVQVNPNISGISMSGSDLTLSGTGGPSYLGYTVFSSSDLTIPLTSWAAIAYGNFKGDGSFSVTFPIGSSGPQQFYVVQYNTP